MHTQLINAATFTLKQLQYMVSNTNKDAYIEPLDIFSGSSIGMHTRHIIEFYQCLIKGLESGEVNYDERERNKRIETDSFYCIEVINECIDAINKIQTNKNLSLFTSQTDSKEYLVVPTNVFRELTYVIEHAIHHMAILKIAYLQETSFRLPENFGVAYSTIKHTQLVYSNLPTA